MKTNMKCYIRRYDNDEKEWCNGYFAGKYDFGGAYQNHWVIDKNEAMTFESCKEAREYIKKNKIKNCNVEQELKHKRRVKK